MSYVVFVPSLDEVITTTLRVLGGDEARFLKERGRYIKRGENICSVDFSIPNGKKSWFGAKDERISRRLFCPVSGEIVDTYRIFGFSSRHQQFFNHLRSKPLTSTDDAISWQYSLKIRVPKPVNEKVGQTYDHLFDALLRNSSAIIERLKNTGNPNDYQEDWEEFIQAERIHMRDMQLPCFPE